MLECSNKSISQLGISHLGAPVDNLFRFRRDILKDLTKIRNRSCGRDMSAFAPRVIDGERRNNGTKVLEYALGMKRKWCCWFWIKRSSLALKN